MNNGSLMFLRASADMAISTAAERATAELHAQHLQFSKAGKNFIFVQTKWGVVHFLAKGLFYSKALLSADLHL